MGEAASEQKLQFLYQLNRGLTGFGDLPGLIQFAANRTRELFQAEGCSLILLDRERNELYFPIVSDADPDTEAKVGRLRFPADQGVAGWVLQRDEATVVADTKTDPRFYRGIDQKTEMMTQSLLCAPLRTADGNIGVIEVVNPAAGLLTPGDLQFLETIAGDVAIACERTRLVESLRGEASSLRQTLRLAGFASIGVGILFLAGVVLRQLAWTLPLSALATSPAAGIAVAALVVGVALLVLESRR